MSILRDKVAAHFRNHAGEWVSMQTLATIGGTGGWRTRKNECERELGMKIENRQRTENGFRVSEYRYVPPAKEFSLTG